MVGKEERKVCSLHFPICFRRGRQKKPDVAKKRMVVLEGIDLLEVDEDVIHLARVIIEPTHKL